ncbi:uncharacterized protein PAS_chr2-1_0421 [Komagataella phaffii GS115]|uniref:ER protein with chaperone and co-chaperone activity, involved in retention of resident ER proteins n=2 Tax=Komagataella phaffii TaxID=460519 RepID=C4R0L9_KOMPG|nr:uncharacterized protein PAS_chr2-1_0421 [Komagataella phaffii GS115]CAY69043.1 ER protein with chaperone and co-chaperone activity, involved in retention of resident ER proteins [Komagataella phaffii GS115]
MRQVDCAANGDFCGKQSINSYPTLRLYGPSEDNTSYKLITTYPSGGKRTPQNFLKFLRSQYDDLKNDRFNLPVKGEVLTEEKMLKLMNGDIEEPVLVSFWPTTDKETTLKYFEDVHSNPISFKNCYSCFNLAVLWSRITNRLPDLETAVFNCGGTNSRVCQALNLPFNVNRAQVSPEIYMFLPNSHGGIRVKYNHDLVISDIVDWSERLLANAQAEEVTLDSLAEKMTLLNPAKGLDFFKGPDPNQKQVFVYYYEEGSDAPEDFEIWPHLLQPIMDLTTNTYIYRSKDSQLEDLLDKKYKKLIDYINQPDFEPERPLNRETYLARTITSVPTFLVFKDNNMIPTVYQNFSPNEIRDVKKVVNFIEQNQFPLVDRLTTDNYESYFPKFNPQIHDKDEKIVISFFSSDNKTQTTNDYNQLLFVQHSYDYIKHQNRFDLIEKARADKTDKSEQLKGEGMDPKEIIKVLSKKIDHLNNVGNVLTVYVDLADDRKLLEKTGWISSRTKYKPGESIIVTRFGKHYWDRDVFGHKLMTTAQSLRETLSYLLFPSTYIPPEKKTTVRPSPRVAGSPYPDAFAFVDIIHQYGLFGYLLIITSVIGVYMLIKSHRRRSRKAKFLSHRSHKEGFQDAYIELSKHD